MARKKVTLQWISNDATRRATFKKRRKGLMKKASELATLCDVDACVVVYGEGESQPEVWPDAATAAEVLARFKAMPELDQCKKMMDMAGLLKQRIDKLKEQLHKARRENRERETTLLLHDAMAGRRPGLAGISVEDIAALGWMVENRLGCVREAVDRFHRQAGQPQQLHAAAAFADKGKQPVAAAGGGQDDAGGVVVVPPPTTLQLQMPHHQQVSSQLPLVPYGVIGGGGPGAVGHTAADVHQQQQQHHQAPPQQQQQMQASWLMEVARAGGDLGALVYSGFAGGRGSFGGAGAGAGGSGSGSSSGAAEMPPQLGNLGAGFGWPDFPPFPPM